MTKVNNIPKTINPHFLEEAGDYLVATGYKRMDGQTTLTFSNGNKAVMILGDNADFMIYDDGEDGQRRARFHRYMQFSGIDGLDMFKWMLLFHITDIVPMQQFVQKEKKEAPADVTGFMVQINEYFRIGDNKDAVPINY